MTVDDTLLERLEKLAMIKIAAKKRESFKEELTEIIAKMDILHEINTDGVDLHDDHTTPMREDRVIDANIRDKILQQAPKSQDGYFIVPRVVN